MATRIAWLLNLDAELELRDPAGYRAPRISAARVHELSARMLDLLSPDDVVLTDAWQGPLDPAFAVEMFCPTPQARARVEALGLSPAVSPPLAVLRAVNSRRFCAAHGHGLPGSCFATDLHELQRQLRQPSFSGSYVLKREFSFAGRERQRVQGAELDAAALGFCKNSFARGEGLQVEPWVERLADFSRHGYLTRAGNLLVGATREQLCDPLGRYLGMSALAPSLREDEERALAEALTNTAAALRLAGYFGPFGIDAFRYRLPSGAEAFDARCEINARFTMGYPRALLELALAERG